MWPFTLSKRVVIKRNIDAPPADIVKMQHDLESLVRLNPLFRSIEKHPTKQDHWIISDNLPILGFQTVSTFECHWVKVDDGVDSEVWAGMGTKLKSKYRVSERGEVTDDTTVEVSHQLLSRLQYKLIIVY
jgi:hypothetical protein